MGLPKPDLSACEQRQHPRHAHPPIRIDLDGKSYTTVDWSKGGFLIAAYEGPCRPGDHTLIDLTKSAFVERLETTMRSFRKGWWRILALPLAVFVAVAGVGLPFEPEDTAGPNWLAGAIAYAVVTVVGLGLVITGLTIRRRNRKVGSNLIAVGVMPGFPMTLMIWFPPIALVGVLSIVISTKAFLDAPKGTLEKVETPA